MRRRLPTRQELLRRYSEFITTRNLIVSETGYDRPRAHGTAIALRSPGPVSSPGFRAYFRMNGRMSVLVIKCRDGTSGTNLAQCPWLPEIRDGSGRAPASQAKDG